MGRMALAACDKRQRTPTVTARIDGIAVMLDKELQCEMERLTFKFIGFTQYRMKSL